MANIKEEKTWEEGIYQLEVTDPVVGGIDGISNKQAKQLANRTGYLREQIENDKNSVDTALAKKRDVEDSYSKPEVDEKFTDANKLIDEKLGKTETAVDSAKLGGVAADKFAKKEDIPQAAPAGTIIASAAANAPEGYLLCDGSALSRNIYSRLFAAIGTTWGAGDGNTTFNIPDLRGEFLRGADNGRGIDSGRVLGSAQGDAIRNITASLDGDVALKTASGAFSLSNWQGGSSGGGSGNHSLSFDASRIVPTANENRPRNVAVNYFIKY
jgi:phage tail collar protein